MSLVRRNKKLSKTEVRKITGRLYLVCSECGNEEVEVPADVKAVTCARCVQKMIAPPANYVKQKSDKPRGWHFKEYFEHDGVVYSKGKEVTDPQEIAALKKGIKKTATKAKTDVKTKKSVAKKTAKTVTKKARKPVTKKVAKPKVKRGRKNAGTTK